MKFYCIADEDTVRGFQLAGVAGQAVASAPDAVSAVKAAVAQPELAIIILTEKVADAVRAEVDRIRFECGHPLIVEIPGPEGPLPGRKGMRQLAQEAVGIHIGAEKGN